MNIRIFDHAEQVGQAAATIMAAQVLEKPAAVLGLATGSSPVPAYRQLISMHQSGVLDFSQVTSFNLDEYVGIPEDHPCSYHRFMQENLFGQVNIPSDNTHVPDGNGINLEETARAYDEAIQAAGGIDLQLLGIGRNGHIGFNEPGDEFIWGCHVVTLTQSTIDANKRFFASEADVPRKAISLGVGAIVSARKVLLIATGKDKAEAIRGAVQGDVSPHLPASILRTHPQVTFLLDRDAASLL